METALIDHGRFADVNVLIVEDDYMVADEIRHLLTSIGYNIVDEASDGKEAIEKALRLRPDLVLMDIEMPVMDGLEATRRLHEQSPVPVVVLTAYESKHLLSEASAAGAVAYLLKPPQKDELERAITIALARHRDVMALRLMNDRLQETNERLAQALNEVKQLKGILPICSHCNKIRDDDGEWSRLESYITNRSEAEFSHGICPDCMKEHYSDVMRD